MKKYSRVCARIDLDAIEYNIEMMKKNVDDDTNMIAVIKTDGYGHGAIQIARLLEPKDYIWGFAVATLDEAIILRRKGILKPVLVLGCIFADQREAMLENEIRVTVYSKEMACEVSELAGRMGKKAFIHIKLDTGMSRLGFQIKKESAEIIEEISKMPNLIMEGMYTHFSKADETDKDFTKKQIEGYLYMKRALEERGVRFTYYHCSNSAGIIDIKEANMDLVRAGIAMYGMYPSEDVQKENVPLRPAMELISHIAHVKWIEPGTRVSYGGTFIAKNKMRLATIPVGYGDGYPRSLSNKGYVLIHGHRAPVCGRICMDQMMVDVTEIDDVKFGDRVTLIGKDGDERIMVEDLSNLSDRFNYEFVCALGRRRIPREYLRHGEVVEQVDDFGA